MGKDMGMCPQLIEAPPKRDNAQAIDMIFPKQELGGSTPTDKAMSHVIDALVATRQVQGPDQQAQSPVYVILATDGAPNDICVNGAGGDGSAQRQGVIAAVDRGTAAGITTWVISLAGGDAMLQAHLDEAIGRRVYSVLDRLRQRSQRRVSVRSVQPELTALLRVPTDRDD